MRLEDALRDPTFSEQLDAAERFALSPLDDPEDWSHEGLKRRRVPRGSKPRPDVPPKQNSRP